MIKERTEIATLGELKASGYEPESVKMEMRRNLVEKLKNKDKIFKDVLGYDQTVLPDIERAILSRHNFILLGLRGQAKTRIARGLTNLLDEYIPAVKGSPLNDDPLQPVSRYARDLIEQHGDETPIEWLHRSKRYIEKLATPDVTIADLIGDVDPIKAANLKIDYSDERVIHFGLLPRSHRSIFVINELPDLQPRIQVALFNILQEGDVQIRGFQMRLELDVQLVFTANPEDYTNRGAIITPLKDRIGSQILTHYPKDLETGLEITRQESDLLPEQSSAVEIPHLLSEIIEQIAFEARLSEFIDQKSGVSARMTITAFENLVASAERRRLIQGTETVQARITDLMSVIPAITGKVELVYEGEQEGPFNVALLLIGQAIRRKFPQIFPDPETIKRKKEDNPFSSIIGWFDNHELELNFGDEDEEMNKALHTVTGLEDLVRKYVPGITDEELPCYMEFVLHGLAEHSLISMNILDEGLNFSDILNNIFSGEDDDEEARWN